MMKEPRLPPELLRAWRNEVALVEPVERSETERERRCVAISNTIRREHERAARRRRLRTLAYGLAAAAAIAAGLAGVAALRERAPSGRRSVASELDRVPIRVTAARAGWIGRALDRRALTPFEVAPLEPGDVLGTAAQGTAAIEIDGAEGAATTRVEVGADTELALVERAARRQELDLRRGHVLVSVRKGAGLEVAIRTPDARVTVHGTVFAVDVAPGLGGAASRTRVDVREGVVVVEWAQGLRRVSAGESVTTEGLAPDAAGTEGIAQQGEARAGTPSAGGASAGAASGGRATGAGAPGARATGRGGERAPIAKPAAQTDAPQADAVSLAVQNRAFERGLRARDQGDPGAAMAIFRAIVRDYPDSPVAESARLEIEALRRGQAH